MNFISPRTYNILFRYTQLLSIIHITILTYTYSMRFCLIYSTFFVLFFFNNAWSIKPKRKKVFFCTYIYEILLRYRQKDKIQIPHKNRKPN